MAKKDRKIFVLDTSVVLYDSNAIYSFQEHDVAIPITVLEEVDQFKKGNSVMNLQAREFIRTLDKLSKYDMLQKWIPLNGSTRGKIRVISDERASNDANTVFGSAKNDHHILNTTLALSEQESGRKVVLVSKDINLRIKARALGIAAEDFETGKIKDIEQISSGMSEIAGLDHALIDRIFAETGVPWADVVSSQPVANHYFILKSASASALAYYNPNSQMIEKVMKEPAYGVKPRNAEQTFAMHALLNMDVSLVTITGSAGTGKTLLALACALERRRFYHQIYLSRPIVPLSNKDIGYLPGDISSKINPYMQPLFDNLDYIKNQYRESDKEYKKIAELVETEKLHILPLAYIRGRSLSNIYFIVDEAQNLTPHEIKTIITRAGENTKIIFTGDIFQIDTPYLDAQSNGLSHLIDRIRDHRLHAHINLVQGERSELANIASELL